MPSVDPSVFIRLGTHAEKEYLEKTLRFFDGLVLGANLVEGTPGATASLLVRFSGKKLRIPYYIDPMTYAYGAYCDVNGELRNDLDWIKSDQKRHGKEVRDFKKSYRSLSGAFGRPYDAAIRHSEAVISADFDAPNVVDESCARVAHYQMRRIADELAADPELASFSEQIPRPAAIFAPYFYIEPSRRKEWLALNFKLAQGTKALDLDVPVHAVICSDASFLKDDAFLNEVISELPKTGVDGVWLWFSAFREDTAKENELRSFRRLVEELSASMKVYNRHGGYFSLALSKYGMSGFSHGVGYGEQKNVLPIIGQSTPTVRYYLPDVHKRFGVPQIERCFDSLEIHTPEDFYENICDCVICKGVVSDTIHRFSDFGEMHRSSPSSKRPSQTPAAAKRCRFHFLLSRIRERDWMKTATVSQIRETLESAHRQWRDQPTVYPELGHLVSWHAALK